VRLGDALTHHAAAHGSEADEWKLHERVLVGSGLP